jgi:hypothetical protein
MNALKYTNAKNDAEKQGISFHKDVMELSSRELSILGEIGKAVHYKNNYKGNSSVTSYSSRFYLLLQRIK